MEAPDTEIESDVRDAAEGAEESVQADPSSTDGEVYAGGDSVVTESGTERIEREHIVLDGEVIEDIASIYGVTEEELRTWNDINWATLAAGNAVIVWVESNQETGEAYGYYTVQPGDRLHEVANGLGTTKVKLIELNNLDDMDIIRVDQKLKYPLPPE